MILNNSILNFTPLPTFDSYLKAIVIIGKIFNARILNYDKTALFIKKELDLQVPTIELINFVQLVIQNPQQYGFDSIVQSEQFNLHIKNKLRNENQSSKTLETNIENCIFCLGETKSKLVNKNPPFTKDAVLYTLNGSGINYFEEKIHYNWHFSKFIFPERVSVNYRKCLVCQSYFYLSYATKADSKERHFYSINSDYYEKYFQFSKEIIVETILLKSLLTDIIFKQTSFRSYARAYNHMFNTESRNYERLEMQPKRITEIFFSYEARKFHDKFLQTILISIN